MPDNSLDRATAAVGELSGSVRSLTDEVERAEALRARKIKVIQQVLYVMVPAVLLLVILAFTNFILLSKVAAVASDTRSTNSLLLGCFSPNTQCSDENHRKTQEVLDQVRQTQFVIAICQRRNTPQDDPEGVGLVHCVQSYYPGFTLPPQVSPAK